MKRFFAAALCLPFLFPHLCLAAQIGEKKPIMGLGVLIAAGLSVAVVLFLRLLFGPRGILRPRDFGTEHIAMRKRHKAERKDLQRRWKRGEIRADEYSAELERIENEEHGA